MEGDLSPEDEVAMLHRPVSQSPVEIRDILNPIENVRSPPHQRRQVRRQLEMSLDQFLGNRWAGPQQVVTHTSFVGGRYSILAEDRALFVRLYVQKFVQDHGIGLHLNERTFEGKAFRFYADIDFDSDEIVDDLCRLANLTVRDLWKLFLDTFKSVIRDILGNDPKNVLFSRRRNKNCKFHINFPDTIVEKSMAAVLASIARDRIVDIVSSDLSAEEMARFDFNKAIDTGVYNSGLRMLGSRKNPRSHPDDFGYELIDVDSLFDDPIQITEHIFEQTLIQPNLNDPAELEKVRIVETELGNHTTNGRSLAVRHENGYIRSIGLTDDELNKVLSYLAKLKADRCFGEDRVLEPVKITKAENVNPDTNEPQPRKRGRPSNNAKMAFFVTLKDRICPFIDKRERMSGEHRRPTSYLYLTITNKGTKLRCFDEMHIHQSFPSDYVALDNNLAELMGTAPKKKKKSLIQQNSALEMELTEEQEQALTEEFERLGIRHEIDDDLYPAMLLSLNRTHFDVAKVVFLVFRDIFRVDVPGTKACWYTFRDHRWSNQTSIHTVFISTHLLHIYNRWKRMRLQLLGTTEDEWDDTEAENFVKLCQALKSHGFKNAVLAEASSLFAELQPNFISILDNNGDLIHFTNGVFDLKHMELREGRPEDYISLSTGIRCIDYNPDSLEVKQVRNFMEDLFLEESTRDWIWNVMSRMLGTRTTEAFYVFTGHGCHAKGSEVLMYDGSIVKIEDVKVGDQLMGDDSTPRTVHDLYRGIDTLFSIKPARGQPLIVNGDHRISVKTTDKTAPSIKKVRSQYVASWCVALGMEEVLEEDEISDDVKGQTILVRLSRKLSSFEEAEMFLSNLKNVCKAGEIYDMSVRNYLLNSSDCNLVLYRTGVEFPYKHVKIDPYLLGVWLGDGSHSDISFTSADEQVAESIKSRLPFGYEITDNQDTPSQKGKAFVYRISKIKDICDSKVSHQGENIVWKAFRDYNLVKNKHIPVDYLTNDRTTRLELLAGIIDSDGWWNPRMKNYEITQKRERLIDQIIYLARSLGFSAYKHKIQKKCHNNGFVGDYFRIQIHGDFLETIPCRVIRKQAISRQRQKSALEQTFKVEQLDDDEYFGVLTDGNQRYLMSDFTVTCNSNGKSKLVKLWQMSFGDYAVDLPVSLITQKRGKSSQASPELMMTRGRKISTLQEPEDGAQLNLGLVKQLTGNDRMSGRELFKSQVEFTPHFWMCLFSNDIPDVPASDEGAWRRIKIISMLTRFVHSNPKFHWQKRIDPDLDSKMKSWPEAFVSILLHLYKNHRGAPLLDCQAVKDATREYRFESDHVSTYMSGNLESVPVGGETFKVIQENYNSWCLSVGVKHTRPHALKRSLRESFGDAFTNQAGELCFAVAFKHVQIPS